MFSGIIEEVGVIGGATPSRLVIRAGRILEDVKLGDSVAVNGACLTVAAVDAGAFAVDISAETAARTTLASLGEGAGVNLERALRVDSRLGGHFVQGHVDGVGLVEAFERQDDFAILTLRIPAAFRRFCVEKGSLAVDGISLTIAGLDGDRVRVALIPHTLAATTAGAYQPGTAVNLEVDLLAKLVAAQVDPYVAGVRKASEVPA